jgi:hypothetical protein
MSSHRSLTLSAALVASAGCMGNQTGDFAATKTGDLSEPLAERRAPDDELVAACGDGELIAGISPSLDRAPYLQRLTDSGTRVLWTEGSGDPKEVRVARPGEDLVSAGSQVETSVVEGTIALGEVGEFRALVDSLEPDQIYCYSLGAGELAATRPAGFRTAPAAGSGTRVSFAAFGDSGSGGADQMAILEQLQTVPFRLMIHTGDIAYESGTLAEFEDNYFAVYAPLLRSFAMFPAIGNHDSSEVFQQVYDLPRSGDRNWYSFDHGDVHFVALDTNQMSDEQAAWLDSDLTANTLEWVVVYGHHPPYSSGDHGSSLEFRSLFGPILEAHRVDLVLSGHDHDYERVSPQGGVHYLVTGGGGRGTRPVGASTFTDFAEQVLHFVYVEIEGDRLLLHAIDGEGTEFDQLLIQH